jgi:hypothetical protein
VLNVPMIFLAASGWTFFLSYRTSLRWARMTLAGFEGQFLQELKH